MAGFLRRLSFGGALLISASVKAQQDPQIASVPFPRFTLSEGHLQEDGPPTSGAKLCVLARPDVCYQMPSQSASGSKTVSYEFGLDPHSERLQLSGGGSWVFFSASYWGGGSGTLERIAVLRYQPGVNGDSVTNLLPYIAVSNVSDRAMWNVPGASPYPVFVDADFIWSEGETHFSFHHYVVEAWTFDPQAGSYVKSFHYQTAKRYSGGDTSPVRVLAPERAEILKHLAAQK